MAIIFWAVAAFGLYYLTLPNDHKNHDAKSIVPITHVVTMEKEVIHSPSALNEIPVPSVSAAKKLDTGNTAWMLISTGLVLFMAIPGLALFYGGMVRKKNVLSTLMHSFASVCLVSVIWVSVGYSLAFREGTLFPSLLGGLDRLFLSGMRMEDLAGIDGQNIPESVFMAFQMTFAAITPAIISGAFVERIKFSAMLLFTAMWSLLVYIPTAHWVWGPKGWLLSEGVIDYAGGTVIHINAGVAGLVAAIMLGKRLGFRKEPMLPHNLVLTMIGAAMLWVGWFGFNAGSALAADAHAGMALAVTHVAASAAALSWLFIEWWQKGKASVLGIASGAVAGLVAITPAAGVATIAGALWMGALSGLICYWGATALKKRMGYDDSLDAFGVHGVGGIFGALATAFFPPEGISIVKQFVIQLHSVAVTVVYSAVATFIILKLVDILVGLRVTENEEREGLDICLHGEHLE